MDSTESLELLKAVIAMAASDGRVSGHEKAIIKALAQRAGVGGLSLAAMIEHASNDPSAREDLFARAVKEPERAMQLLVAAAQIDGNISEPERNLLVDISCTLGVSAERFGEIFQAGMATSKRVVRDQKLL